MIRSLTLSFVIAAIGFPSHSVAQSLAVQQMYQKASADEKAGRSEQAVADYRELIRSDPSIAAAYNNLGRLYYNLDRLAEAAETLRQGLALDPGMAPANVVLGAAYFRLGDSKAALAPLEAGVKALPRDRFARMTLARVLIALDRPEDAAFHLNQILAISSTDQEVWYMLGKLHLRMSQQEFAKVQSLDANTTLAHEMAGEIMESMQNTAGAVDAYKQAIAVSPTDASAVEHLANLYWSTGDWTRARSEFANLLKLEPRNCSAHWKLANAIDEIGDPSQLAMDELNLALDECPALAQAHAERARLLLRTGKPAAAIPDLEVAEKAAPDEPSIQQLFAKAYRALGDQAKATAAQQRFRQLEAEERSAKEKHASSVVQSNN